MTLRWAILGTGGIARGVMPRLLEAKGCSLTCVVSRDPAKARSLAAVAGLPDRPSSICGYDELPRRADVDAVYITLPNHLHAEWCIRLLRAGKHVLCEKPLCATLAEAERIAHTARDAGRLAVEGFMYLHHPQSLRLRELAGVPEAGGLRDSPIGRLKAVRSMRFVRQKDQNILSTRLSHAMEGGAMMDLGCYPLSIARFVTGAEPTNIRATARFADPLPGETGRVDIACLFSFTLPTSVGDVAFEGGASFDDEQEVYLELIGDKGTARTGFPFSPDAVRQVLDVNGHEEVFEHAGEKFTLQFERFAKAVLGEVQPLPSMEFSIGQAAAMETIHHAMGLRW